jgi:hypothetical protein
MLILQIVPSSKFQVPGSRVPLFPYFPIPLFSYSPILLFPYSVFGPRTTS